MWAVVQALVAVVAGAVIRDIVHDPVQCCGVLCTSSVCACGNGLCGAATVVLEALRTMEDRAQLRVVALRCVCLAP